MENNDWVELKTGKEVFDRHAENWEIEIQSDAGNDKYCPFKAWDGRHWNKGYLFRGRPRQPKMKEVKMLCWISRGLYLDWCTEGNEPTVSGIRQPHLDMIAKVPE